MEQKSFFKRYQFTFLAILIFLGLCFVYFSPLMEGKTIRQGDVESLNGVHKEIFNYKDKTGESILWTNQLFGGMPTYQIWLNYPSNIAAYMVGFYMNHVPNPVGTVFMYMIGFFILLRVLKVNPWLSIAGSIAFAFSSYNFIIITAGHVNKAMVIGLFAPTIAGIILAYRGKLWQGGALTALALALQIKSNHYQMSYYLALAVAIYIIIQFIYAIREKTLAAFFKSSLVLAAAAIIAVGVNLTPLLLTEEYAHETIRGKTELTLDPKASQNGLSEEYAFEYSYGVGETFTLLVPNFYGGPSQGELSKNSETYATLQKNNIPNVNQAIKQMPLYWGEQYFTEGPVYFGAIIVFLFILGLFVMKGREKWWILATVILTIMLSWGKNFMPLSDLFFKHFPLYNKFRAVSSILTVTSLLFPLLAILAFKEIIEEKIAKADLLKALRNTLIIVGGLLLIFIAIPGIAGNFSGRLDEQVPAWLKDSLVSDRESLLRADAFRSLVFILLTAGVIFAYVNKKVAANISMIALAVLITLDMWTIDKRYLNNDDFVKKAKSSYRELTPTQADLQILQDKDPYYRVFNVALNPFTDASTSYFHKSIGGYHAAKLKRYQELIENQIAKNNMNVLNMLNTKYFIVPDQATQQPMAQQNPGACGNAWFISEIKYVANADSEMLALTNFNPLQTVIVDKRYEAQIGHMDLVKDSASTIKLANYHPDLMTYESNTDREQFAVFSEIYYDKGWNAYIDGQPTDYFRVNYLLRAMKVPAGKHTIEFKFEPRNYIIGERVSMASSILLVLFIAAAIFFNWRENKKITPQA